MEFRQEFPKMDDRLQAIKDRPGMNKTYIDKLYAYESQWKQYCVNVPATQQEREIFIDNYWLVEIIVQIYANIKMLHKDNNVGVAVILYGGADTCKSTICRIIAGLEAPWQMWGGTQWIQNDTLKWDTVTRTRSKTLITEEMVWQDVNKKIACENTLQMIKEQLTGAGAHNRQNKSGNKSNIEDQTLP